MLFSQKPESGLRVRRNGGFIRKAICINEAMKMTVENAISKTIRDLSSVGSLTGRDVANLTSVSKATVSRWMTGRSTPRIETQLVLSDLRFVADKLAEFYRPDEVRVWLYAPNELLGGQKAIDLIHDNRTGEVLDAIEQLSNLNFV